MVRNFVIGVQNRRRKNCIAYVKKDIEIRLGKALGAIWKSNLPVNLRWNFSRAAVETVLVYGSKWCNALEVDNAIPTRMNGRRVSSNAELARSGFPRLWFSTSKKIWKIHRLCFRCKGIRDREICNRVTGYFCPSLIQGHRLLWILSIQGPPVFSS